MDNFSDFNLSQSFENSHHLKPHEGLEHSYNNKHHEIEHSHLHKNLEGLEHSRERCNIN